ncbi:hypothetical protein DFH09DRAFT_1371470 [Mycena vulgaris]|nr:hypothetical protein DFH09DRAFT_1371470 [Mycena vulgaris]
MKNPLIFPLLSAAAFAASQSNASNVSASVEVESSSQPEPEACQVRAWVRAQDLSPDNTSHGELRIKVPRAECAHQVASVALRLQLDEFGEFKFLKAGVVLPAVQQAANQSKPVGYADWGGSSVVSDYQARDDAMSDPAFWTIGAEERCAHGQPRRRSLIAIQPVVTPFTVAVPAVNYPPGLIKSRHLESPLSRHSFSDLGYRYTAVVTFTDGRIVDVPAGYTTFIPTVHVSAEKTPFSWNTTFEEAPRCGDETPYQKKAHRRPSKKITLDEGNIVQAGLPIKGRVTVHSTSGSTTVSDIRVSLRSLQQNHWAQAQATAGGDIDFYNATSTLCIYSRVTTLAESDTYSPSRDDYNHLTPAHPSFDFEVSLPLETPVDFASYYSHAERGRELRVPAGKHAWIPKDEAPADDVDLTEEGLWDSYTALGKKVQPSTYHRQIRLQAVVPITVVGKPSAHPIAHYLTPGLGAPVLRPGSPADAPVFPVVQPGVYPGGARQRVGTTDADGLERPYPDPTKDYRWDNYAGLLWRKKVVAEERGIWPLRAEVAVDEGAGQQAFAT